MTEEKRVALGPAGESVARNLKRIREAQRITYVALAERVEQAGRVIPVLGLRRIERGERRVDVDDLLALALALGVSPVDLLVPGDLDGDYHVTATSVHPASDVRAWIAGLTVPESMEQLAARVRWMPRERATAVTREWVRKYQRNDLEQIEADNKRTAELEAELGYFQDTEEQ